MNDSPSKKCCKCGAKKFTNLLCKCGKYVCVRHRYAKSHSCEFDYKKDWAQKIKEKNPQVKRHKVIPI